MPATPQQPLRSALILLFPFFFLFFLNGKVESSKGVFANFTGRDHTNGSRRSLGRERGMRTNVHG